MNSSRRGKLILFIAMLIVIMLGIQNVVKASENDELNSDKYTISELYNCICRVRPKTSVEIFKQQFNMDAEKIHVYSDITLNQELEEGYVGTGMILTYDKEENTQIATRYFISVIGDTDGNGEIEQLELLQLIRYVVDRTNNNLSLLPFLSVDMNMDGKLDIIDITLMIRYVTFDTMENIPENVPNSPIIEVAEGEQGIENWYRSDVKFKIETNESSPVEILKNVYALEGKVFQREKDIAKDELVTLSEEGTYTIKGYSYSVYGTKSEPTSKVVKIDKQAPTITNISAKGENANVGSIVVSGIDDEASGVYQISITQNEQEPVWEDITDENYIEEKYTKEINKSGTWYVSVKDKAGNIVAQSIEVTNVKEKVSNIEVTVQDIIGIGETYPVNINYNGEAKEVRINIENDTILQLDESINSSEEVKDENNKTVGYHVVKGIKGAQEGNVTLKVIIEDYDGTTTEKTFNIIVVDKEKSVALVERMYYPSIASAIDSIDKEGTVIILKDVEESFIVPANKIITLEIKEFTITGRINNQGDLTIASGSVQNVDETIYNTGTVVMQNGTLTSSNIAVHNLANATMTIKNGDITSQGKNAILNYGNMVIENANIKTTSEAEEAISNGAEASLTILDGKVEATNTTGIKNKGTLTIGTEDANVDIMKPVIIGKNYGIYTTGTFNWFDGNITAREIIYGTPTKLQEGYLINRDIQNEVQVGTLVTPRYSLNNNTYVLLSEAVANANPGDTITLLQDAQDISVVEINKKVILNLNGFTLTRDKEIAVTEGGNLEVKGGKLQAPNSVAITVYMGNLQVENATIIGENSAISQSTNSTTHILSGEIRGNVYGIKSSTQENTIILGDSTSAIKLENPNIVGEQYGIFADAETKIYYYSGKIQGKQDPGYYAIQTPTYREGYITGVTLENEYYVCKLISNSQYQVYARRDSSVEYYTTIAEAINYASAQKLDTTISFMRDITEDIIIPEKANITLEMGEYVLNGKVVNEGTLTVANGKITNNENTVIYNSNTLYVNGGIIESNAIYSPAIYNERNAKTTINGGKITSSKNSSIINCGTLEVVDGEILSEAQNNSCIVTESSAITTIKSGSVSSSKNVAISGGAGSVIIVGNNEDPYVSIELPAIKGKQYGIDTESNIIFYDGKIDGDSAVRTTGVQTLSTYSLYVKNYSEYQEAIVIPVTDAVRIGENVYGSLQEAIEQMSKSEQVTIEILRNIKESVTIPEGANVILDVGNYSITGRIRNKGTLNLIAGTLQNDENSTIYNEGTLTITNGTVKGNGAGIPTLVNATKGIMTITGGEIVSQYSNSIDNRGFLTITNNAYIYSYSQEEATILNPAGAYLMVSGGRITNYAGGKAIDGEGTKNVTDGVIEPAI